MERKMKILLLFLVVSSISFTMKAMDNKNPDVSLNKIKSVFSSKVLTDSEIKRKKYLRVLLMFDFGITPAEYKTNEKEFLKALAFTDKYCTIL